MNQHGPGTGIDPRALHIIRVAILISPLAFGAIVWYILGDEPRPRLQPEAADLLALVFLGTAIASAAALGLLRVVRSRTADLQKKIGITIAGWAVGEGIGLLGGVVYLLTAARLPFLVGISLLFVSMMMLPLPLRGGRGEL